MHSAEYVEVVLRPPDVPAPATNRLLQRAGRADGLDGLVTRLTQTAMNGVDFGAPAGRALVSWFGDSLAKSGEVGEDFGRGVGPHEGRGAFVGDVDIVQDRRFKVAGTAMNAAPPWFVGQRREPALHQVDPRGAGRSEVHVEPRVSRQLAIE